MSNARAFLLLPVAVGLLVAAAFEAVALGLLGLVGVPPETALPLLPPLSAALAGTSFLLLVAVLVTIVRNQAAAERARPYRAALRSFAAEFGQGVFDSRQGVAIDVQRDGQRVEVRVDPHGGFIEVRSPPPARQSLSWTARDAETPPPARGWREVEHGEGWRMHAELPVMARPLLADGALMDVVGRFFERKEARTIVHTLGGMTVLSVLPVADQVDGLVRLSTEIAFRLRRVNG